MAREGVTSDPDRGVPVNSGTDPQRPGTPARPAGESAPGASGGETPAPVDPFDATHQPKGTGRQEDVETGGKGDPSDAL